MRKFFSYLPITALISLFLAQVPAVQAAGERNTEKAKSSYAYPAVALEAAILNQYHSSVKKLQQSLNIAHETRAREETRAGIQDLFSPERIAGDEDGTQTRAILKKLDQALLQEVQQIRAAQELFLSQLQSLQNNFPTYRLNFPDLNQARAQQQKVLDENLREARELHQMLGNYFNYLYNNNKQWQVENGSLTFYDQEVMHKAERMRKEISAKAHHINQRAENYNRQADQARSASMQKTEQARDKLLIKN